MDLRRDYYVNSLALSYCPGFYLRYLNDPLAIERVGHDARDPVLCERRGAFVSAAQPCLRADQPVQLPRLRRDDRLRGIVREGVPEHRGDPADGDGEQFPCSI